MALSISSLAAGRDTTNNPATTASVNPTAGSLTLLFVGVAVAGGGTVLNTDTVTPSGARGTWSAALVAVNDTQDGSGRRGLFLFAGTGSVTNEAITLTSTNVDGTWTETNWSVIQVTGQDTGTPYDAAVKAAGSSGTTSTLADVGTPGAGDAVVFGVFHETDEAVTATGWSSLGSVTGGSDIRTLHTFYDDSSPDETPNATWASSSQWGTVGLIVNVAAGGGGGGLRRRGSLGLLGVGR